MKRVCVYGLISASLLLSALALLAPGASAVVVREPNGHALGVTPRLGVTPASIPNSLAAKHAAKTFSSNGNVDYNGGPVVHSSAPYLIFWTPSGESIPSSWESLLERYFTDVAADSGKADDVYGVDRQYTDGAGIADYKQTFSSGQAIVDTQPYPAQDTTNCSRTTSTYPTCITDAQLQAEVQRLIAADGLPTDGSTSASELAQNAPIYFVVLPTDVNECVSNSECADNTFCAYHGPTTSQDGTQNVLYAAIPTLFLGSGQDPKDCQDDGNSVVQEPNGNLGDVITKYMSHEDNETITDPLITAWYDDDSGNEIGDNCNFYGSFAPQDGTNPDAFEPTLGGSASAGTLYDQLIDGDEYYIQSEWSNGDVNCEMRPAPGTLSPTFTVPSPGSNPAGQPVSFNPSASAGASSYPISSATWNFGDGSAQTFKSGGSALASVSHSYASVGKYTVTLTLVDDRGNLQSTSEQVTIGSRPTAAFTYSPDPPASGSAVSFDGSGSSDPDSGVTITSYAWNFGDGTTGTGTPANHTYSAAGTYTATLTVTNSLGITNTTSQQVRVTGPIASFTIENPHPAVGQSVSFDGSSSTDSDATITSYGWNFGDGATQSGSDATATHAYTAAGTYTVTLTIADSDDQTSTVSHQLVVGSPPTAAFSFSPQDPVQGTAVTFNATGSSDPDGGVSITSYSWNFGDGTTGTGPTPSHTYFAPGSHTVTVTVTNSLGLTATTSHQVSVSPPPVIAGFVIRTANRAVNVPVSFDGSFSEDPDGSITSYAWSFGDGTSGAGVRPSHTYTHPGTYIVSLTVAGSSGLHATAAQSIVVVAGSAITKVRERRTRKGVFLVVSVNGPGTLTVGSHRIQLSHAQTVKVKVAPGRLHHALRRSRRKLNLQVKFMPLIGAPSTRTVKLAVRR